jgi:hypothetical protein
MGDSVSDIPTAADAKRLRMEDGAASPTSSGGGSTEEGSRSAAAAPASTAASPPPNPAASGAGSSVGGDGRDGGSSGAGVAGPGGAVDDADVPRKKDGRVDGKMLKAQRKAKRMRDKLTVNDRPPGFDDAALGIAFEDYQAALRVLGVLYDRPELLEEKCLKALRVAMAPLASARAGKVRAPARGVAALAPAPQPVFFLQRVSLRMCVWGVCAQEGEWAPLRAFVGVLGGNLPANGCMQRAHMSLHPLLDHSYHPPTRCSVHGHGADVQWSECH